ncbi:hypothetical protein UK12_13130 [Saccharothrix sp. ST-888]|nr:hypothetical protein UK12_13130 [Saccharothrix sp. ST-888]
MAALRADDVPYGCFSDFSAHSLELDGHLWPTSEHCFLAQKFIGTRHADLIRRARTPLPAAELGRARPNCCGGTGTGKNMLGRILTRTGNQLRVVEVPGSHERSG